MSHINKSWREQRKAVVAEDSEGYLTHFISIWQAAKILSEARDCDQATAKKEIKKSIKLNVPRYGYKWRFEE